MMGTSAPRRHMVLGVTLAYDVKGVGNLILRLHLIVIEALEEV